MLRDHPAPAHMSRAEPNSYREQREGRRRAYQSAPTLGESFPRVEEIRLEMSFSDPYRVGKHSPQTHAFLPAARAFFEVACPCSLCIGGGFDLRPVVAQLTARAGESAQGELTCQGWQSRDRVGAQRCLLLMRYHLTVRYRP